jgi:hypothetical protein
MQTTSFVGSEMVLMMVLSAGRFGELGWERSV